LPWVCFAKLTQRTSRATAQLGRKRFAVRVLAACRGFVLHKWRSVLRVRNNGVLSIIAGKSAITPTGKCRKFQFVAFARRHRHTTASPWTCSVVRNTKVARKTHVIDQYTESRLQLGLPASSWSPGFSRSRPPERCGPAHRAAVAGLRAQRGCDHAGLVDRIEFDGDADDAQLGCDVAKRAGKRAGISAAWPYS